MKTKPLNCYLKNLVAVFFFLTLSSCESESPTTSGPLYSDISKSAAIKRYRLAIHPLHNPKKLIEAYNPLIDYLNKNIKGVVFEVEASRDYQAFEEKFRARKPEFILPNPWQTLEAMKVGYNVIAMAGDAEDFKGIFIARKDSSIQEIKDLKGKTLSYPSLTALAASIMPQQHLYNNGINVTKDIINNYVGSQESAIMNTYLRQSDVGVTWPPPWRLFQQDHPNEAKHLKQIWETPPLMNNSVMVRDDIDSDILNQVQSLMLSLDKNSENGLLILNKMSTSKFHLSNNDSYEPVKEFIKKFEIDVRPVESK